MSVWETVWLPPSQRNLFSTSQMFRAVCCAVLSCVYNKEVLVWRRSEGKEVGGVRADGEGLKVTVLLV